MSFNYVQKCCEKSLPKRNSPFYFTRAHATGFMETIISQLHSCTCACIFHPLPLPGAAATDFSPSWVVTSSQTDVIWTIFFFFFRGGRSSSTVWPPMEPGDPQPLHQQLPGVKSAAAGARRAPSYCMGAKYYCKKRGEGDGLSLVARKWVPEQQLNFILTLSPSSFPFEMHIRFYFTGDLNALLTAEITNLIWTWDF